MFSTPCYLLAEVRRIYIYIQLPAASPPPCPEQIPQDPFWVPWAPPGLPFGYPWVPLGTFLVPLGNLGHLLASPQTPFGSRTKKETKSDMEDPRSGVQVGTQNRNFSEEKKNNKHEKEWAPRQGLEKGSCLEGVKTLKVMTLTTLWAVF